jgi:hypothetical protein
VPCVKVVEKSQLPKALHCLETANTETVSDVNI